MLTVGTDFMRQLYLVTLLHSNAAALLESKEVDLSLASENIKARAHSVLSYRQR